MIEVHDSGAVRTLTFAREDKLNAFNAEMYRMFARRIAEAGRDPSVHVILLAAKGRAFTAGQDLHEMATMPGDSGASEQPVPFEQVFDAIEECDTPLYAAVEGFGLGFGLTLLLHTDQNFISRDARFRLPFLSLGVVPEAASSYLLPLRVGMTRAMAWVFEGDWIPASELYEAGLARELTEPGAAFERAMSAAQRLAAQPPKATAASRALMWKPFREAIRQARHDEGVAFSERLGSDENIAALRAFASRASRQ